ncbi:hypothetical protein HUJ04_011489 [Dendroctonus ponderosae]|nr:hypothetical protein HUJ04_011489 [Dendroctonus ponderosae]
MKYAVRQPHASVHCRARPGRHILKASAEDSHEIVQLCCGVGLRKLATRLQETGNVQPVQAPERVRRTGIVGNIVNVFAYVQYDPALSTRKISDDLRVPKIIFHKILQNNDMHPYHIVSHQALNNSDYDMVFLAKMEVVTTFQSVKIATSFSTRKLSVMRRLDVTQQVLDEAKPASFQCGKE